MTLKRIGFFCFPIKLSVYPLSDISMYVILKEDAHNFDNTQKSKTKFLVKGISAADVHAAAMRMLVANPSLNHLRPLLSPACFVVDGYIGLGVPIGLMPYIGLMPLSSIL